MTELVRSTSALQSLYRKVTAVKVPEEKTTVRETSATRMAKWQKSVTEMDQVELSRLEALLESFVQEKFAKVHVSDVRTLDQEEIDLMAAEYKDLLEIEAMVSARKADMKRMTFTHINVEHADDEDPEHTKGELVSEKEGLVFRREGGNPGEPTVDWEGLKETLDSTIWEDVQDTVEIPATTIQTPSIDKLLAMVELGKIDIELLRPFVHSGPKSAVKFVPRPLKQPRPQ